MFGKKLKENFIKSSDFLSTNWLLFRKNAILWNYNFLLPATQFKPEAFAHFWFAQLCSQHTYSCNILAKKWISIEKKGFSMKKKKNHNLRVDLSGFYCRTKNCSSNCIKCIQLQLTNVYWHNSMLSWWAVLKSRVSFVYNVLAWRFTWNETEKQRMKQKWTFFWNRWIHY